MSIDFTPIGSMHSKARNITIKQGKLATLPTWNSLRSKSLRKGNCLSQTMILQLDKGKNQGA
jgi:hypothetical protein